MICFPNNAHRKRTPEFFRRPFLICYSAGVAPACLLLELLLHSLELEPAVKDHIDIEYKHDAPEDAEKPAGFTADSIDGVRNDTAEEKNGERPEPGLDDMLQHGSAGGIVREELAIPLVHYLGCRLAKIQPTEALAGIFPAIILNHAEIIIGLRTVFKIKAVYYILRLTAFKGVKAGQRKLARRQP